MAVLKFFFAIAAITAVGSVSPALGLVASFIYGFTL